MKTLFTSFVLVLLCCASMQAQTQEELLATKAAKEAELATLEPQLKDLSGKVDAIKSEIESLKEQTTPYPRWDIGALGNAGFNSSSFNNWFSKLDPNTTAINVGVTTNIFANLQQRKYFWRNSANLTLGWIKYDNRDDPSDSHRFNVSADAMNVSSLLGYKLSEKFAISTLGEYRTTLLDFFNDPGYLDLGAGGTWTPVKDLVVVFHPLNYNFIFFSHTDGPTYESSLGVKIVADYKHEFKNQLAWKSNLSVFGSYENINLSNWTWVNSFSTTKKGIGLGFDVGLRGNKQEALAAGRTDNPLQSYWIVGLAFKL